jgi:hypothetical protein
MTAPAKSMPWSGSQIDEKRMAGLSKSRLLAGSPSATYPSDEKCIRLRPNPGERPMTRFLFLKFARIGHQNGSRRGVANEGIDVRLLSLLSARYV